MVYVKMIKFLKHVFYIISIGVLCLCLYCCTPSQKLKRLVSRHPELLKSDTTRGNLNVPIIPQSVTNDIPLDTASDALASLLSVYFNQLDSLKNIFDQSQSSKDSIQTLLNKALQTKAVNAYKNKTVLIDTFYIALKNNGYVKIYQLGKSLKHILYQPPYIIKVSVPIKVDNVYKDIPWRLAWYWVLVAFVCGVAIILLILQFKKK